VLTVKEVQSSPDIATARELFVEYQHGLGVDLCFQSFDEELKALQGRYARPTGRLLLASHGELAVGVVAMRGLNGADCEMKRLYVRPEGRGLGVARLLTARLIDEARVSGYRRILLDTLPDMTQAQALYRSIGFSEIAPYCENPTSGTLYMALDLLPRDSVR
jgi:ribosomal protein S18 acetylase RimI-like enzyme